mgnify:CR=1 FL=1
MAFLQFDATNVPQADVLDPIPAGWYNCAMDESEMKPAKTGNGQYLSCRFTILDGLYVGRKVYMRFNLQNDNPVAQEIGWKQLSSFCHAVGRLRVQDSQELHGLPVKVKVKLKAAEGTYEASNDVTGFKNINEQTGPAPVGGAPGFPGGGAPTWGAPNAKPQFQQPQFQQPQQPQQPAWAFGGAVVQQAGAVAPPAAQHPWAPQQEQPAQQPAQQPAWAAAPAQPWAAPQQAPAAAQQQPAAAPPPASAAQSAPPPWVAQAPGAAATPPWVQPAQ